jgi:hypothetical protein
MIDADTDAEDLIARVRRPTPFAIGIRASLQSRSAAGSVACYLGSSIVKPTESVT